MCDTLIAPGSATSSGIPLFGKNSDRPPNEGQSMVHFPATDHLPGSSLKCTYIEIPQVQHTYAVLLSKPFWMWGAEMGINEHGLVIGNEAVYSKVPANKKPALLGMDLLRLALERAITPRQALQVIVDLLEEFGQGGNCASHGESMYYHNSFLIANASDAWVLETIDRQWAARQVTDPYSISNCLTLEKQFDLASTGLVQLSVKKGYSQSVTEFNYALDLSDTLYTTLGKGRKRCSTTRSLMNAEKGRLTLESIMSILRHHAGGQSFDPQHANPLSINVCMHAGFGPVRISQSTASFVASLDGTKPLILATGTAAPCTGIFKPFWLDALPDPAAEPSSTYDPASLFWAHERLHRATLLNYPERLAVYASERDELERGFLQEALKLAEAPAQERARFVQRCHQNARQAEADWLTRIETVPAKKYFLNNSAWNSYNRKAAMPPVR